MDSVKIIIDLLKLITTSKSTSFDVIEYIKTYGINVNTYLPSLNGDGEIPLLYYCCSNLKYMDLFKFLISENVSIELEMNTKVRIELLYYSQTEYIPMLIKSGAKLNPEFIVDNGQKLLIGGNVKKLMVLYKYGAIAKEQLVELISVKNLVFSVIDRLYERMFFICQNSQTKDVFEKNYQETMKNYIDVYKLIFINGVHINQINIETGERFIQQILNTYFMPLIEMILSFNPNLDEVSLMHHSNFNLTNRQIMKYFYNQESYEKITEMLRPHKLPQKIIMKKVSKKK